MAASNDWLRGLCARRLHTQNAIPASSTRVATRPTPTAIADAVVKCEVGVESEPPNGAAFSMATQPTLWQVLSVAQALSVEHAGGG